MSQPVATEQIIEWLSFSYPGSDPENVCRGRASVSFVAFHLVFGKTPGYRVDKWLLVSAIPPYD